MKYLIYKKSVSFMILVVNLGIFAGCSQDTSNRLISSDSTNATKITSSKSNSANSDRNAYFGDLHSHSFLSVDAYALGTRATPDEAYAFAKGTDLSHVLGFNMKLREPLDFFAVTDHAFFLGAFNAMSKPDHPMFNNSSIKMVREAETRAQRMGMMGALQRLLSPEHENYDKVNDPEILASSWAQIVDSANRHNDPGVFTAFIGYEYTAMPGPRSANLHRNVIFRSDLVPEVPFSRLDSQNPEDLWRWMDSLRSAGIESMAIPHNSNGSDGQMFSLNDFYGNPMDRDYANLRMRNEPLVEVSQLKGTSETHPSLSPRDEWAGFEIMPYIVATNIIGKITGSYIRSAYKDGLRLSETAGFDPFSFGLIASSDSHNASSGGFEDDYWGKVAFLDGRPSDRGSVPFLTPTDGLPLYNFKDTTLITFGASGLAGVWAEKNTRESLYDAMRRKETFGTSGTRIRLRFFAGNEMPSIDNGDLISESYKRGVPMGGKMKRESAQKPEFIAWAMRDSRSASLDRLQVIKGWLTNGVAYEQVYDVACSGGEQPDPITHRCPNTISTVNTEDCSFDAEAGEAELKTKWTDPSFKPAERAFYYLRVLEAPICRWSTWDAIRAGSPSVPRIPKTIQERAWSSPIWYEP